MRGTSRNGCIALSKEARSITTGRGHAPKESASFEGGDRNFSNSALTVASHSESNRSNCVVSPGEFLVCRRDNTVSVVRCESANAATDMEARNNAPGVPDGLPPTSAKPIE